MALIATPGAVDANSYLTVEEADAYFATRLHASAWTALGTPSKEAALIWATRLLDTQVKFTGQGSTATQNLAWPRTGMLNQNEYSIPSDVLPRQLKEATAELALYLVASDRTLPSEVGELGLTSLKAGPVSLSFKDEVKTIAVPENITAMLVWTWLYLKDPFVGII